ncbi:unnamed protein product, partial [Larinioides sclopetarius]
RKTRLRIRIFLDLGSKLDRDSVDRRLKSLFGEYGRNVIQNRSQEEQQIMPASRIGRIHLIYQLIILAILIMFIGCDELLSERKYIYLSIICTFIFAVMILSSYTELQPIQAWISQFSFESLESNEENCKRASTASEHPNFVTQEKTDIERDQTSESCNKPRVYRLRNWRKNGSIENKSIEKSPSIFDASSIVPMEHIREYNFGSYGSKESDLTKRYYFPFRQKRLEEWVDSKESRPHKIRPLKSNHLENTESTTDSSEVSTTKNPDQPVSSISPQSPDLSLPKSYSFPFRRKRLEHWMEIQETQKESLEITSSLPQWETMDYSEYDPEFRMRRSFSGSALNSEELDSEKIEKEKDFSQSVEIAYVANAAGFNVPTSSNTIDKIKAGFKDYFSKRRKDSFKGDIAKGDSKRRPFKSFFQSKENVSLNVAEKKLPKLSSGEYYKF